MSVFAELIHVFWCWLALILAKAHFWVRTHRVEPAQRRFASEARERFMKDMKDC